MNLIEYARQFGRFQRNARLYLVNNILSGVTTGIFLLLYNLYLVSLGYNTAFIGILLFVATIGAGLAIFPAGLCIDRFSGKAILIWSNVIIAIAGIGQILFRQPLPLLATGFVGGIGIAFILVINAPFLTANSTPDERPHLFSVNIVLALITSVLGSVLGGSLPQWFRGMPSLMAPLPAWLAPFFAQQTTPRAYQISLLLAGLIAAPSFIPLFLLSSDRPSPSNTRHEGRLLMTPNGEKGYYVVLQLARSNFQTARRSIPGIFRRQHLRNPIVLLTLVQALIGLGAGLFIPYTNIYFVQRLGASPALYGLLSGGATALTALLTLASPWFSLRLGRVKSIALSQLVSIPLLLSIGLLPILPLVAVLFLLRQPLMDMCMGILQVFSMEAAPQQRRGVANSSYQAAFQVTWAISASIGGFVISQMGYPPVFIAAATCYMLAIITLWSNFGRGRRASQGHQQEQAQTIQMENMLHS